MRPFYVLLLCGSCAHVMLDRPLPVAETRAPAVTSAKIVYRGEQPFVQRGNEEWLINDVQKSEMLFSPNGRRFAFARPPKESNAPSPFRIVVRNLAGDPVNEFPLYRKGRPERIVWIDNRRIGYLCRAVPEQKLAAVYVVHDAESGDVLQARSGVGFVWGPESRHVAFVTGAGDKQILVVDGRTVWPRTGTARLHESPVWSPDGHGLALVDQAHVGPRLVVLVEYDDPQGDLTWNIPKDALSPGLRVFWAGDSKVVIGQTALQPRFAAGWERLH